MKHFFKRFSIIAALVLVVAVGASIPRPAQAVVSTGDVQTIISQVQSILASLAGILENIKSGSFAAAVLPTLPDTAQAPDGPFRFTSTLQRGVSGNDVRELQSMLLDIRGIYAADVTGYFGPITEAGVKEFQKAYGLTVTGIVDSSTRARLNDLEALPGRIIVKVRGGASKNAVDGLAKTYGASVKADLSQISSYVLEIPRDTRDAAIAGLSRHSLVARAEVDQLALPVAVPNDTNYASEWHLSKIGTPTAWDSAKGDGVTVAILDSGIDSTHPDFSGKLVTGWNLVDNNSDTSDVYGHGTKVAGVVGATTNNATGVASIGWNTKIMPVRVALTSGSAYISTIASGITYAADHGAQIANASFATLSSSATIQSAANYMKTKGGLVTVAAGNYGTLDSTPDTTSVISVSATNSSDVIASWSSYGPYIDVAAPGDSVWSTTNGGGYAAVSGTSFSSPAVAAVLALIKSANTALTNTQVESILKSTAVDLGATGYDQYYGNGRVNASAAVSAARAAVVPVPDTTAPIATVTAPTAGTTVSGSVAVNVTASDTVGVSRVELYANGSLVGTDTATPYAFTWDSTLAANGASESFIAYAYDAAGNKGTSPSVSVTVNNPVAADTTAPSVTISTPSSGSTVSGAVNISGFASDANEVSSMSIYVDGVLLSSNKNKSVISKRWHTSTISTGTHKIEIQAYDKAGNKGSSTISVTVVK